MHATSLLSRSRTWLNKAMWLSWLMALEVFDHLCGNITGSSWIMISELGNIILLWIVESKYSKLKNNNWNWIERDMSNHYTPAAWAPVPLLLWLYSGSFPNHHLGHCRKWTAPLTATLTKPHFSQLPYKLAFP